LGWYKQTRRELQQVENEYKKYLTSESGVELEPLVDEEPLSIPLHFHTPYGFMGAYLLADFDRFIRLMISIRHYALMSDKEILTVVHDLNRKVRRALSEPLQWKSTGVTREDIKLKTDKAGLALAAMGRISEAVLSKKIAPPFSPKPVLNRPLLRS
jgi:integrating conjugative element protein (TIGR03761 family)